MRVEIKKIEKVELTIQEWQQATRGNVYRNRKKYTRKKKHRNSEY
jgi:hypothetical protein